jgi:hypothetical protein
MGLLSAAGVIRAAIAAHSLPMTVFCFVFLAVVSLLMGLAVVRGELGFPLKRT